MDLKDDHWDKQGRKSIDAVAIFGGLLAMSGAGSTALQELGLLPGGRRAEQDPTRARRAPPIPSEA